MSIERFPVRIRFNVESRSATDLSTNSTTAAIWRGNDIVIDVGVFHKGSPLALTNVALLTLQIKDKQNPTAGALAEVALNAADLTFSITDSGFSAGSEQHGSFIFTSAQTNQSLNNAASRTFWLVLSGVTTTGKSLTYGALSLAIHEDNAGVSSTPPVPAEEYYTKAEMDAILDTFTPGGGGGPVAAEDITDAGTAGIAAIQAETAAQLKAAAGLTNVQDLTPAQMPVSDATAASIATRAPLVTPFLALAGSGVLTLNSSHRDNISADRTFSLPASPAPTSGSWWRLNLNATANCTVTLPSSSKLIGTDSIITTIDLTGSATGAGHEIWNELVGSEWIVSHTANADVAGLSGPGSVTAGRISVWVDENTLGEATVTVAQLQTQITDGDSALQDQIDTNDTDIAALQSGKAPLVSPDFTGGTPLVPTASRGTSTTQAASTEFVSTMEKDIQIVVESTTARTLSDTDRGKDIRCTNGSQTNITVNTGLTVGGYGFATQAGAGKVTFVAGSGVTLVAKDNLFSSAGQPVKLMWQVVATNTVEIYGDRIA